MAPLCADPRQVVIALDQQHRLELLRLVDDVLLLMTSNQQAKVDELGSISDSSDGENDENEKKVGTPDTEAADLSQSESDIQQAAPQDQTQQAAPSKMGMGGFNGANFLKSVKNVKNVKIPVPWQKNPNAPTKASKRAEDIQLGALQYMVEWQQQFMPKFEEIARVQDNDKILAERKSRGEALENLAKVEAAAAADGEKPSESEEPTTAAVAAAANDSEEHDLASLQEFYTPMPTSLTTLPLIDRKECISCILLLLLSTGKYSAHSRAMILYMASSLNLSQTFVNHEECQITESLMESSTADNGEKESMSAEAEAEKRRRENKFSRMWKVGLASVAGATIVGVTGGLAAPLVAGALGGILGGVGLGGVASFLGIFWMNGALVGALFGAYGAKMTVSNAMRKLIFSLLLLFFHNSDQIQGSMMDKYAKEVDDFCFIPLKEDKAAEAGFDDKARANKDRRLRVTIGVNGWLNKQDDITKPWRALSDDSEVFALRYEMKTLLALGSALKDLVQSFAWKALKVEIIKRTVLATLFAALWPIQILSMASNVDNPFSHASNRSKKAGRLLADALINRVQGERPVTLVGYSLGAVAIHSCLQELAERQAFGLIDTVVVIGAPAPSDPAHWRTLRTVVSGKIFNVYSENDMVLGFVYRMHSLAMGVAGLQAINGVAEIHNYNLSDKVSGHLRYPSLIGGILRHCGFVGIEADEDIEKDELIQMKQDYAEGKDIDEFSLPDDEKKILQDASSKNPDNDGTTATTTNIPQQSHQADLIELQDDVQGITLSDNTVDPHAVPQRKPVGSAHGHKEAGP